MPTIDLSDDELAAITAAIRRVIEGDRYPRAPRLDALRAALARLEAAAVVGESVQNLTHCNPKAPPPAKAAKQASSSKIAAKAPAPKISPSFKLGRLPPDR